MLFHSSIRKELARSFGATLIVLTTVVMTMTLIRTLGQASLGSFNPSDVTLIMGYTVLAYMPTILTMSLFIAIIASLSRMYRDSEMVIWFVSGRGLATLLRPLFRFAWPILLVVMALATTVLPWSNGRIEAMRNLYEKRGDIERVEPGRFQESAGGTRVFFVEKNVGHAQTGSNVFIATIENGKQSVTTARSGRIQNIGTDRFLLLNAGERIESAVGTRDLKISAFDEYGLKVGAAMLASEDDVPVNTRTTLSLLHSATPHNRAELSWRIGLVLAAINFVVIGVGLSSANPRVGRSVHLVFAIFAFILYYNLLNLGQTWIASGAVSLSVFLLALHGSALAIGCLWLTKEHNNWHGGWWLRRTFANHASAPEATL